MPKRKSDRALNQPAPNEQSGSTGRNTSPDKLDKAKDTGQDRYGQSGFGGKAQPQTPVEANYRQRQPDSNKRPGRLDKSEK
jgi:hypothetical protein